MAEADILHLFHTGYAEIREPDIHYGRKNADFGQGFYLSDSDEFAGNMKRLVVTDIGIVLDREENKIADPWREEYAEQGNIFRCPSYLDMNIIDTRDVEYSGDRT